MANPNCENCLAETTWFGGSLETKLRRDARLCPECYNVKLQLDTLGQEALIECMECDERRVLRIARPEFNCKPCRQKQAGIQIRSRGVIARKGDSFENRDPSER